MTETNVHMFHKTFQEQIDDLQFDNRHLYFLLGALTNAVSNLPELHRCQVIKTLQNKTKHVPTEMRDTLTTLIEAMNK